MDNIVIYLQTFILQNSILPSFFFMLKILLIKWLCISFYFNIIYFITMWVKKTKTLKRNVQATYYCWYALFLSFALANLEVNNHLIKLSLQTYNTGQSYTPYAYIAACLLSVLWLLIVLWKIVSCLILNRKIQKSLKRMPFFNDRENLLLRAKAALSMNKKVKVMIADYIVTPVSYGIVSKYILLPNTYEEKFTSNELYLMLLHELSHIKNGDTIKFRLINFMECFMWFNPVMHLFYKKFRQDTEILCDNQVVSVQNKARKTYGQLLLKGCSNRKTVIGYGFSDSYHLIKDRIDALYCYEPMRYSFTVIASCIVILFMTVNNVVHYAYANNLDLNPDYNSVFEITLSSSDFSSYKVVDSNICNKIYEIKDDTIYVDQSAIRELLENYSNYDYEIVAISSRNFSYSTDQFDYVNGDNYHFRLDEVLNINESNQYFTNRLSKRNLFEHLFLVLTNKI